jgi:Restriction endonuclease ThaI
MDYSKKSGKELVEMCKEKGIKGYSGKKKETLIEMLEGKMAPTMSEKLSEATSEALPDKKIDGLELLKSVLENPKAQKAVVMLYAISQMECTRNGSCGMEVGMSREKDQGAVLKLHLGDRINLDIDNTLTEDYVINGDVKISAKHSGGKVGTPVKVKWTSADVSVQEAIKSLIEAEEYPHLLITYMDTKAKKITIICITAEHNENTIKKMKEDAFKVPKGNSRGIEYSTKAMAELLSKRYFTIEINDADLNGGENPIERRMKLVQSAGLSP